MSASEAEGRRLYGPPPQGDEDPHANQYPSDPAETTGPPRITAGQLNSSHLGYTIRVTEQYTHYRSVITGTLAAVEHWASQIEQGTFTDPGRVALGKGWVRVTMLNYGGARVSVDATVELLD